MRILLYLCLGCGIGVVSGAVGIGGGVLLVPALMLLCGMDYRQAAGTSLAVLSLPVVLPAAWESWRQERVEVQAAVCIAVAFAGSGFLGAFAFKYLPVDMLRPVFGLLLLFIGMRYVVGSSDEASSAAAGLAAWALAWVGFVGLRRLGRRHLAAPDLGTFIREKAEQDHGGSEYYI
jgi:uncharacterized membrane protein YfcA